MSTSSKSGLANMAELQRLREVNAELIRALRFARRILAANDCGTDDVVGPIDEALAKCESHALSKLTEKEEK